MNIEIKKIISLWLLYFFTSQCAAIDVEQLAIAKVREASQILVNAHRQDQPIPVLSANGLVTADDELAYNIQTAFVKALLLGSPPQGFKAGLTTVTGQKKFAVGGPVAGVLIEPPLQAIDKPVLNMNAYHRMMIEMELGFRFKHRLIMPPTSIKELKTLVAEVVAVIEIPDLGFDQPQWLKGADIIAGNVAAKKWIVANAVTADSIDINALQLQIKHNQKVIISASSGEVMNDQWQALFWLVNRMINNDWVIEPEQTLITGAIGTMLTAKPGEYSADFSQLGRIQFSIIN